MNGRLDYESDGEPENQVFDPGFSAVPGNFYHEEPFFHELKGENHNANGIDVFSNINGTPTTNQTIPLNTTSQSNNVTLSDAATNTADQAIAAAADHDDATFLSYFAKAQLVESKKRVHEDSNYAVYHIVNAISQVEKLKEIFKARSSAAFYMAHVTHADGIFDEMYQTHSATIPAELENELNNLQKLIKKSKKQKVKQSKLLEQSDAFIFSDELKALLTQLDEANIHIKEMEQELEVLRENEQRQLQLSKGFNFTSNDSPSEDSDNESVQSADTESKSISLSSSMSSQSSEHKSIQSTIISSSIDNAIVGINKLEAIFTTQSFDAKIDDEIHRDQKPKELTKEELINNAIAISDALGTVLNELNNAKAYVAGMEQESARIQSGNSSNFSCSSHSSKKAAPLSPPVSDASSASSDIGSSVSSTSVQQVSAASSQSSGSSTAIMCSLISLTRASPVMIVSVNASAASTMQSASLVTTTQVLPSSAVNKKDQGRSRPSGYCGYSRPPRR